MKRTHPSLNALDGFFDRLRRLKTADSFYVSSALLRKPKWLYSNKSTLLK